MSTIVLALVWIRKMRRALTVSWADLIVHFDRSFKWLARAQHAPKDPPGVELKSLKRTGLGLKRQVAVQRSRSQFNGAGRTDVGAIVL